MNLISPTPLAIDHPLAFMARRTPQLQAAIEQQQAVMPAEDFAEMMVSIRSLFSKYSNRLAEFAAGVERATALHRLMDRELEAAAGCVTSCAKGCSGCCHYEVEITQDEAALLSEAVQRGVPIDHKRLSVQAARPRQSPEWRKYFSADNRCVFLSGDGACQVYDERPSICRKHLVSTPASSCTKEGETVSPVRVLLAEILLSASLSLVGARIGSLSKMLVEVLPGPVPVRIEIVDWQKS